MKKVISLVFALLMLCTFVISAGAEEFNAPDRFSINLPEGFEQTGENESSVTFGDGSGDVFTVSHGDNTVENEVFCVENMSEKDIEKYTETLSQESEKVMKGFADKFELKFLSAEKQKHKSGKKALVCQIKTTITKNNKTLVYYQTMYEFGGTDYKYTFTYTTPDEGKKDNYKEVFDSINVFEAETESNFDKMKGYAVAGAVVLLVFMGIIRFIRTPEKRAQGKL